MNCRNSVAFFLCSLLLPAGLAARRSADNDFLGRWDINLSALSSAPARHCWLELMQESESLAGRFNPGGGAAIPLKELAIINGELKFQHEIGRGSERTLGIYSARLVAGRLVGTATLGKETPRTLTGVRAPVWPAVTPLRKPGTPVLLFNGKDLSGWRGQKTGNPAGWTVKNGVMTNDGFADSAAADNIYTRRKFRDFKLEVELNVSPKTNSGIFLRGRYEIQVMNNAGRPLSPHSHGALYGFITPGADASKPPGEWQKFEITLIANRVTVVLNGTKDN
jgi:hypothetical protein